MQATCSHVCQCGHFTSKSNVQSSSHTQTAFFSSNHSHNRVGGGEWVWSTRQGFTSPSTSNFNYASSTDTTGCAGPSTYQATSTFQLDQLQQGSSDFKPIESSNSFVPAWLPQNETLDGLWGASAFVDIDGSPVGMAIDLDVQTGNVAAFGCNIDLPITPLADRQESLPTPGLVHSPSSSRACGSVSSSTSVAMSAQATSSVASTPSIPATPTSLALLDLEASLQPMAVGLSSQAQHYNCSGSEPFLLGAEQSAQGLSSAFDFTNFPQTQPQSVVTRPTSEGSDSSSATATSCVCSAALTRTSTTISPLPMPSQVAMPEPGWLNPDLLPSEMLVEASGSSTNQMQQSMPEFGEWSELLESNNWLPPATTATASRYEPYRNPSVASTASSSSQGIMTCSPALSSHRGSGVEVPGSRRRSLTVGSLSGLTSSSVDRVRVMGVNRPPTPSSQQHSVPSSPRLATSTKFSSMPCRRSRPAAPALASMFSQDVETASIKERRMASLASKTKLNSIQRSPLAGLFAAQDLLLANHSHEMAVGGAEPSPTVSELSLGLNTPTSSNFSPPCTPVRASLANERRAEGDSEENANGTVVKAKIALHHHRTKLQRNILNEVVTSLQGAYKHCRRQYTTDAAGLYEQSSLLASELGQLQLPEHADPLGLEAWMTENEPSWSTSGIVVAGETKEMRKNRQKAESKMRMRRKEIAQFAALIAYAKLAYAHVATSAEGEDVVGRSLAQVFLEHKDGWTTLVALEKRLFHTVRVKLGLQELVVRKLTERLAELSS
ncbi:uncharacterized protein UTRI_06605_B [Ustilago trichophora]|uniref:Uncharacterized protein n=1 Tax=Ustilago trichophora TaxID=86804 RepID=A0A5C3EQV9_9BASI|nr:uncharacterized protein UTRI_06605_B [Ustilago trichophora]